MATIQEMQQARDLMKNQGIPLADAVSQVRNPVTPAVTPTSQINQDQFAKNQAERQANPIVPVAPIAPTPVQPTVTGVNGEKFVQAPIDQSTGLSTPQAQATTPVQAEVKPQEPIKTDIASSIQPIDKNAEIQAKNEAQMALNKQKAQIANEDRKRQAEEARVASIPTDEKGILNTLISGGSVTTQNTPEYRSANYKHKNYQKFNAMTSSQLLDNIKMGEIDTETSQLLAQNPNYIQAKNEWDKIQKSNSVNAMINSAYGGVSGKSEKVDYYNKSASEVAKRLGVDETNAEAYSRIVGRDPLVNQLTQTVSSTAKQLNQLNNDRNQAYKELMAQYPAMDKSSLMVLMGSRTQDVTDQVNALNSTLSLTQADLKSAMQIAKGEYDATSQDIQAQQDISKEQRQVQAQKDMMQYQSDFQKKQAAQALNDPATAIQTAIDEYKKLGIPFTTTVQSRLAEFNKSGKSLPDYLTQMRENIQASTAYKKYESLQNGQLSDREKLGAQQSFDIQKIKLEAQYKDKNIQRVGGTTDNPIYGYMESGKVITVTSPTLTGGTDFRSIASQYPNEASLKNNNPAGLTWNNNFDNQKGFASVLMQNGVNFTKGTNRPTNEGGAYVSFPTVQDGMKAYSLLWQQPQYQNMTVQSALNKWGTGSLNLGGINPSSTISSLDTEQLKQLQSQQLKKESPGFFNELVKLQNPQPLTGVAKIATDIIAGRGKMPTGKEGNAVIEYIANNNLENGETGNLDFIKTNSTDKQSIASMLKMLDDLNTVKSMPNKNAYTGIWDSWSVANGLGMNGDTARAKMTTILNTNLNNYIKEITGATVGKDEAPRLIATQPTMGQSDTNFNENLDSSIRLLENKLNALTSDYRFDSIDNMRMRVLGKQNSSDLGQNMSTSLNDMYSSFESLYNK